MAFGLLGDIGRPIQNSFYVPVAVQDMTTEQADPSPAEVMRCHPKQHRSCSIANNGMLEIESGVRQVLSV
jgi:hypothetical protein